MSLDPGSLGDLGLADPKIEAELAVPDADVQRMQEVLAQVLAFGRESARPRHVSL
ncbi:hypothetical protein [Streptomyces mirabilis]|uniref:hypothetical protein n=1 Tax=Streptomyces mirabilis TaxID=68239 RepID=UPI0036D1F3EF